MIYSPFENKKGADKCEIPPSHFACGSRYKISATQEPIYLAFSDKTIAGPTPSGPF